MGRMVVRWPLTSNDTLKAKAASLAKAFEIETVLDLLMHYPRRYVDRSNQARIVDLKLGEETLVLATVKRVTSRQSRGRPPRSIVSADVSDGSGYLKLTFFNQRWRERQLPVGTTCVLFGKVDEFRGQRQMTNPVVDLVGDRTGRIIAMYPQSEKERITTWDISRWMEEVLARSGEFADPVPRWALDAHRLVDRTTAFRTIHFPESTALAQVARARLVFDELLRLQLALVHRKRTVARSAQGIVHDVDDRGESLVGRFQSRLPFVLTDAQKQVIGEITADLANSAPMHRLLQGDVGAGKTLVAVHALLVAVQGGHQGALMAPTEVLAEQHYASISELLAGFTLGDDGMSLFGERPLRLELLTNRVGVVDRRRILAGLADGSVDIAIGTHALIQDAVDFADLGVVVVDEQHRFGVEQRAALRDKSDGSSTPDVLVMTATPIPRTAAMTVYGDLDVSVIDELPPGRTPIVTRWLRPDEEDQAWKEVRAEVSAGRQAYVVCPLIQESEKLDAASAEETLERLCAPGGELDGLAVGLLHGRLASAEKNAVMGRFRRGALDVVVATTVIEVGVDVPNATVMVILDADRFGIAQLHQLRGRVGRGADASRCYLVAEGSTPDAEARLEALVRTTDGFALAEVDLELRGEGTLMSSRQTGRNDLKLASLHRDRVWIERARAAAERILDGDPDLTNCAELAEEVDWFFGDTETDFLFKS